VVGAPSAVEPLQSAGYECRFAWTDNFGGIPVTAETQTTIEKLALMLEQLGCRVERQPSRFYRSALQTFGEIIGTEIAYNSDSEALNVEYSVEALRRTTRGLVKGAASMQRYVEALLARCLYC